MTEWLPPSVPPIMARRPLRDTERAAQVEMSDESCGVAVTLVSELPGP